MIESLLFMLGLGGLSGIVLSIAAKIFYVYEDPRIALVADNLAGANCGGCGFAGCSAAAAAVVSGKVGANVCIISSPEQVQGVAAVMGLEVGTAEARLANNLCEGGNRATNKFHYLGINTCKAMAVLYGGGRDCSVGCIGLGDCIKACQFGALSMGKNGFPVVDENKCVGCGACQKACPKNIIVVSTLSEKLMKFNQSFDPLAPCAQRCPAEINIPLYISQIRSGDYAAAVQTIRMRNPLLLSCGRVCPHPCEDICRRGVEDEPVSINQLKRFVADYEMNSGSRAPIKCAPDTGRRVAVIGGGPAGLSNAYFLRRLGHDVTIFEAMPELGGILRYGIPEYRLPKKVLAWEIQGILDLGIKAQTNVRLGVDFGIGSLIAAGYEAIFMGIGAWKDYGLGIPGEDLTGCFTGIDFLSRCAAGEKFDLGKKAGVIGGGNTAVDCARTMLRLGVEKVYIIYRRTRKEMPANEVEIAASEHEGIEFVFLAAPVKVIGNAEGRVTQLEYLKMELGEPDASGRRRPIPIEGSETKIEVDTLVTAIGQQPDLVFANDPNQRMSHLKITKWNTIDNDPELLQSSIPYIFTGGDSATGPSLVVTAIGAGRRAARSIDLYLKGKKVTPIRDSLLNKKIEESIFESVPGIKSIKRAEMPALAVSQRIDSMVEVDQVLPEETACAEACRCLHCCRLCYNPDI